MAIRASDVTAPAPRASAAARTVDALKVYGKGQTEVRALDGVSVEFATGQFTAIMGPSGSGKSTLLHCVAGMDTLTSGQAFIGDADLSTLDDQSHRRGAGRHRRRGGRDRPEPEGGQPERAGGDRVGVVGLERRGRE